MSRPRPGVVAVALAVLAHAGLASAQPPAAVVPDRLAISTYTGVQSFDYKETIDGIESDYRSRGPAWGVAARFPLADRWRLNADYLGSFVVQDVETWDGIGTVAGLPITQQDDLTVGFHLVDADVSYSPVRSAALEWAVALGWRYYRENFERSNFRFIVSTISIPLNIAPVDEDVTGQGVKLGTTLDWRAAPRWVVAADAAAYWLYDVSVDNSALGTLDSDGWAARWGLAVDYLLGPNSTIGLAYRGDYLGVNQETGTFATLPDNRTWAHTLLVRFGLRF